MSGAGGHVFGWDLVFFRDVDNPSALWVVGAAEKGAEFAKAQLHGIAAFGALLLPVKGGIVIFFVELESFKGAVNLHSG